MNFVITVTGETIANDKKHYAQGWTCLGPSEEVNDMTYHYDKFQRRVQGNLILNKKVRAIPYAFYFCEKGIRAQLPGDIGYAPGAMAAELCYKNHISEITELFNTKIPSEIEIFFYNGLITGIFSIVELFLSDVLLCLIFTNREVYNRTIDKIEDKLNLSDPVFAIQQYFTNRIVYHRFDEVEKVFKRILQISLPDTKHLRVFLHKRNNIAHRFAFSNIDRMEMTTIDLNLLNNFIICCNEFVDELMVGINRLYKI